MNNSIYRFNQNDWLKRPVELVLFFAAKKREVKAMAKAKKGQSVKTPVKPLKPGAKKALEMEEEEEIQEESGSFE